jgi:hypothetical protein
VLSGTALYGVTDTGGPLGGGVLFSLNIARPAMQISKTGGGVIVSWPSPSIGYVLQQNATLMSPGWLNFLGRVNNNGVTKSATVVPAPGVQFYRLEQQ